MVTTSCKRSNDKLNWDTLIEEYSENPADSIKLEAIYFLRNNIKNHVSDTLSFKSSIGKHGLSVFSDTLREAGLRNIIENGDINVAVEKVPDVELLTNSFIKQQLEAAFQSWNRYPWAKKVPKGIFFDYLLPYKIFGERPDQWREYLSSYYDSIIKSELNRYDATADKNSVNFGNELYYTLVVNQLGNLLKYDLSYLKLADYPSFRELIISGKGDCIRGAYMAVYALRSAGLPAAMDVISAWGSKNGGHAAEVFWNDSQQKMQAPSGRGLHRASKIIRFSYSLRNAWTDSIQPAIGANPFELPHLMNDHWHDVTAEHTTVSDIVVNLDNSLESQPFAYICVYNYGQWQPVYWGSVKDGKAAFRNMGRNIIYTIGIPHKNGGFTTPQNAFLLDKDGVLHDIIPSGKFDGQLNLKKINSGADAWLKKGTTYTLFQFTGNNWSALKTVRCEKDSMIVFNNNVRENAVYRLREDNNNRELERPFLYRDGQQIWY